MKPHLVSDDTGVLSALTHRFNSLIVLNDADYLLQSGKTVAGLRLRPHDTADRWRHSQILLEPPREQYCGRWERSAPDSEWDHGGT